MSRGMYYFEAVVAEVETGSILQPEVDLERGFVEITRLVHRDVSILHGDLYGCEAMRSNQGMLLEITVGADMIKMLVGIDDDINISYLEPQDKQGLLQGGEVPVKS